ncbi:MAG: hypothetical protein F6K39_26650 [Okeania sp. SIO3B3]|nr:hypothetical protein [Okeania sp. SIO3B3]
MIDEFLELISTGQPYFVAINTIYKVIDSSPVVKALEKWLMVKLGQLLKLSKNKNTYQEEKAYL